MPPTQPSDPLAAERENEPSDLIDRLMTVYADPEINRLTYDAAKEIARLDGIIAGLTTPTMASSSENERREEIVNRIATAAMVCVTPHLKHMISFNSLCEAVALALPPLPQQGEAVASGSERARVRHCASRACREAGRYTATPPNTCNIPSFDPKITREWFERKAALEDGHEVGAGFSMVDAPPASQALAEPVALHDLADVFERPFTDPDDPRLRCAKVLTLAEAEAVLEHRGDLVAALSGPAEAQARVEACFVDAADPDIMGTGIVTPRAGHLNAVAARVGIAIETLDFLEKEAREELEAHDEWLNEHDEEPDPGADHVGVHPTTLLKLAAIARALLSGSTPKPARAKMEVPEGWALVPLKPSRKLINDLAHEWAYNTEEAMESYHGFLDVVARHGFGGSDPAAYDDDAARADNTKPAGVEITEEMVTEWSKAMAKHLASRGYCFTDRELFDAAIKRALTAALSAPAGERDALPQDVIDLVIAAREYVYQSVGEDGAYAEVDKALEAFASRVPWELEADEDLAPCLEARRWPPT